MPPIDLFPERELMLLQTRARLLDVTLSTRASRRTVKARMMDSLLWCQRSGSETNTRHKYQSIRVVYLSNVDPIKSSYHSISPDIYLSIDCEISI